MTRHLTGTRVPTVAREAIRIARGGDFRAMRITLFGQPGVLHDRIGIVTPHRNSRGEVDAVELRAQVHAIAFDAPPPVRTRSGVVVIDGDGTLFADDPTEWD